MPKSSAHKGTDLSKFQLRLLALLAAREDSPKGLTVQDEVSEYYGEEVNHGRLYPNLTSLAEDGFVEIGQKDKRTNSYTLTEVGRTVLDNEIKWLQNQSRDG